MDLDDLKFCQDYFRDEEQRDPTITEIRMIDTYWSDHCRHTTFFTHIDRGGDPATQRSQEAYRRAIWTCPRGGLRAGRKRPVQTLMDMATIGAQGAEKAGRCCPTWTSREEINACSIHVPVDVDGEEQDWLLHVQKRDPQPPHRDRALRRRGHLHRRRHPRPALRPGLRLPGHARHRLRRPPDPGGRDPARQAAPAQARHRPPRRATPPTATRSAWPPGMVSEVYHPGYVAKRLEIGAVVGAAPAENVVRGTARPRATW